MDGGNFFDQFTFWNTTDPTNGFVLYQTEESANNMDLISSSAQDVRLGVDHTGDALGGRPSVRITSKASYEAGLFIIDLEHMPGGICGTWPAFWLVGPNWPDNGEVDIIEGVNNQQTNRFTLHTGPGCSISGGNGASSFSGTIATSNCDINAAGQDTNAGCSITTTNRNTYGTGFNQNNGGIFATEWTDNEIAIYFFDRQSIPSDISSGDPNPSTWTQPIARFTGSCNFGEKFNSQQIVFDTTFCGDWAGATFTDQCGGVAKSCEAYVADTPNAFVDAYWSVKSLRVYQDNGAAKSAPSVASSSAAHHHPSQPAHSGGTRPSVAPSGPPETSRAPGKPTGTKAPGSSHAPSPATDHHHERPTHSGWHAPSHTWGGQGSWQSGGWNEMQGCLMHSTDVLHSGHGG